MFGLSEINLFVLIATGLAAGLGSGLLGVGGGFLMNPILYLVFLDMGLSPDLAIRTAFGTGIFTIMATSISGTYRHHTHDAVNWRAALVLGGCSAITAVIGSTLASHISGNALKIGLGILILGSTIRMLFKVPEKNEIPRYNLWLYAVWGIPVGLVSGLAGIGGGLLIIPILLMVFHFKMHDAVATSLAMVFLTAIGGTAGYIVNGLGVTGLLPASIGYIYLPAWFILGVTSAGMAQIGAILSHRLKGDILRYIFIVVMIYFGLKMVGFFDWLGWHI